jgi:hypothetical protein
VLSRREAAVRGGVRPAVARRCSPRFQPLFLFSILLLDDDFQNFFSVSNFLPI